MNFTEYTYASTLVDINTNSLSFSFEQKIFSHYEIHCTLHNSHI